MEILNNNQTEKNFTIASQTDKVKSEKTSTTNVLSANSEKKTSLFQLRKQAETNVNELLVGPFQVVNTINKLVKENNKFVCDYLERIGLKSDKGFQKITLEHLCSMYDIDFLPTELNSKGKFVITDQKYCIIKTVTERTKLESNFVYGTFADKNGKEYYKSIISYTVNNALLSIESNIKLKKLILAKELETAKQVEIQLKNIGNKELAEIAEKNRTERIAKLQKELNRLMAA